MFHVEHLLDLDRASRVDAGGRITRTPRDRTGPGARDGHFPKSLRLLKLRPEIGFAPACGPRTRPPSPMFPVSCPAHPGETPPFELSEDTSPARKRSIAIR